MTKYLYCINDYGEDFITTSFDLLEDGSLNIYNFSDELDMKKMKYVAIDFTNTTILPSKSWGISLSQKYTNSDYLKFYEATFVEQDIERKTVILQLIKIDYTFDLRSHKRDRKIDIITKS